MKCNEVEMISPETALLSRWTRKASAAASFSDYGELMKPRLLSMVILSTAIGFVLGSRFGFSFGMLIYVILGTLGVGGGAMALNQWMEHELDARMARTWNRPIPSGRLKKSHALAFGITISLVGLSVFIFCVNLESALVAFLTSAVYLFGYTPLKTKTSLATFVGAISGALPPLIGWSAAGAPFNHQALSLFSILFFWQLPHFLAIDWMYREDHARAGFRSLAVIDETGKMVVRQMMVNMSALFCVSLLPAFFGISKMIYSFGAFCLGIGFTAVIIHAFSNLDDRARFVLRGSIVYLALLLILMVIGQA